jgi:hypothetical protein
MIISVSLHVRHNKTNLFRHSARRRQQHRICKELSRGFTALGVYHSHHSERKGGAFAPHIHLIFDVPELHVATFLNGLQDDLRLKDRSQLFELSPRSSWRTSSEPLQNAVTLWAYVLGSGRKHLPEIIYGRV